MERVPLITTLVLLVLCTGCARVDRYNACQAQIGPPPNQGWALLGPVGGAIQASTPGFQDWGRRMDVCTGDAR